MLRWRTAKRWTYRGRHCEIQRATVGDAIQYRGLVEVETGLSDAALRDAPVANPRRTRRPKRHDDGEYREWVYFDWSGREVPELREVVNDCADHVLETEL